MSAAKKIYNKIRKKDPQPHLPTKKQSVRIRNYSRLDYIEPYILGIIFTICFIIVVHLLGNSYIQSMTTGGDKFPLTFQGFMWLVTGIGVGTLLFKNARINEKLETFEVDCFPADPNLILDSKEIAKILLKLNIYRKTAFAVFPQITSKVLKKYQTNKSVEAANSMLNSQMELLQQRSDTEYNSLRYYSWLLPSLGFMGTVYGISEAVAVVGQASPNDPDLLKNVAISLAIAFDTTLLALIQSSVLLFFMNKLESKEENLNAAIEERIVNEVINRLS